MEKLNFIDFCNDIVSNIKTNCRLDYGMRRKNKIFVFYFKFIKKEKSQLFEIYSNDNEENMKNIKQKILNYGRK